MNAIAFRAVALSLLTSWAAACASDSVGSPEPAPSALWSAVSDSRQLSGRLSPESGAVEVGRFQSWILELRDARGAPVAGAAVAIGGGMPAHGHGLPTQPQVTAELADGRYRIEGVKLNMHGDWVIEVLVQTPALRDRLRFDLEIDF